MRNQHTLQGKERKATGKSWKKIEKMNGGNATIPPTKLLFPKVYYTTKHKNRKGVNPERFHSVYHSFHIHNILPRSQEK